MLNEEEEEEEDKRVSKYREKKDDMQKIIMSLRYYTILPLFYIIYLFIWNKYVSKKYYFFCLF